MQHIPAGPGQRPNTPGIIPPLVLIYEENDLMRGLLAEWLGQDGYRVCARTPDRIQAADAALVIVSLSNPKEAGVLLRAIQAAHPGTPRIALSAQFRSDLSTAGPIARSLGVQLIMAKPLGRVAFMDAVRAMIGAPIKGHAVQGITSSGDVPSRASGSLRFRRLRRRIVVVGALALLANVGSSVYDVWHSRRDDVMATQREIGNVAGALAEQTAWTWQAVDLLLSDTARWVHNDLNDIAPDRRDEVLASRTAGVRQVRLVTLVDAQGIQRHRSRGSSPPNLDVSDRSYFVAQRDGTAGGTFMSEPVITRSEGRAGVILSRRLAGPEGRFEGVVTAIVDLAELQQFYAAVTLGRGSAIRLLREDGTLLASNPPAADAIARKFPQLLDAAAAGRARLMNPIDGADDFISVARVRDTPLWLAVTREHAAALETWRSESIRLAVRTIIITLLGIAAILALLRQLRRIEMGERALRESEERYALVMEGANEGHWDWNLRSGSLFLSPTMKTLQGQAADWPMDTWGDWSRQVVIHPDDGPRFDAVLADHLAGRTPQYVCEYRVRQPGGEWRWLLARGRCLRDASGRAYRFLGSAIDVTAGKLAHMEKERLESQLRQSQKMEAIGTLAGGIAHDFNNILGAILGYGELAHQRTEEGSAMRRHLDNVLHAAGRAKKLVDRILGFSRSGMGERVPVNMEAVVQETLDLLGASLPAGIRLEARLQAGNAAVIGDATRLHQVTMNLCTNAVQAMPRGGRLGVLLERVELAAERSLARGVLHAGPHLRLSVSDTGGGIPAQVLERMFDPFFTTKGVGEGTGLGLSLVHGIVADLGGAIDIKTQPGAGTTFDIWLPVSGETPQPDKEAASTWRPGNGQAIMIVDDEPQLLALCEEVLAAIGYEPVGFNSGAAALRVLGEEPGRFDAILTDEAMPEIMGTDLAREVRRLEVHIPIILMSGHAGPELAAKAGSIGICEVLHKPLQTRDLAEALARALANGHSRMQS